jgi:lipoprotein-releasing system permease protein
VTVPFEWILAVRFLREGRAQTMLILSGIGVGVGVVIFLSALITGLQVSLIDRTLGTQAHIVVRPPDDAVRPMISEEGGAVLSRLEQPAQRLRSILNWQVVVDRLEGMEGVTAIAPTVSGAAFATRGNANKSVLLRGIETRSFLTIIDMRPRMRHGKFDVSGTNAVIGTELAKDMGVSVGDKLRVTTPEGASEVFFVSGVFDVGNRDLNERWVFVSLRTAQTLLNLVGGVSTIELKVDEIFDAEVIAERIAQRMGLVADSWMTVNTQLLTGLRSQNASSHMIQFFVIVAVALGIASVLIVSVVQKSREIGILKAIGTPTPRVVRVFLLEGAILGLVGSIIGIVIGTVLSLFFQTLASNPDGSATFPVALNLLLYVRSCLGAIVVGILAAIFPARRAASLEPAEVIRYG